MSYIEVTAAIIQKDDRILAAQRSHDDELSHKWEFPGGKIEPDESAEECIVRELKEELNIETKVTGYLGESEYDYGKKKILLKAFFVEHISGKLQAHVHQNIRWVNSAELKTLDWAAADIKLVDLLIKKLNQSN